MKFEVGESLGYSYLRHVQQCWLVQTNWKASKHWDKFPADDEDELEKLFNSIRDKLKSQDSFKGVFKKTATFRQLLKQAEIDVVGVRLDGGIYAVDVAFHEGGLLYRDGTVQTVLKKMLRTMLVLRACRPDESARHIYFASPTVRRKDQERLVHAFDWLGREFPAIDWRLMTNNDFSEKFLGPVREKARHVKDTSELFVRSLQLLELGGLVNLGKSKAPEPA